MANKRPKPTAIVTPFGRAAYCALSRPSDKFKADGEYSARILLDDGPETQALIAQLDNLYEAAYQTNLAEVQKDKPKVQEIKRADKPYRRQEDPDTGEQLPGFQLNGRVGAIVRGKKGADGQPGPKLYDRRPQVVDAKKQPVRQEIGSGSIIRLSLDANPFYTAALGSGLSMRLIGVQVKELVPVGMRDAGFGETDGFESKASDPVETIHDQRDEITATEPTAGDVPAEW